MNEGLGESLDIEAKPPPNYKNTSLEERVYSTEYIELSGFSTNNPLGKKIKDYFRVGLIAKSGLEKASEVYRENLEDFDESRYLLEKGQTPTLLHKYAKKINRLGQNFVRDKIKDFEHDIGVVAFKYRGLSEKTYKGRLKLNHFECLDEVLKHCKMKEIKTRNDVVEALMLAQEMGLDKIIINRWDRRRLDNEKVGGVTIAFFEKYYKGNKMEIYNKIKDKISKKFGRTMSKSTFYRYIRENKETINLPQETDVQETDILLAQSNVS